MRTLADKAAYLEQKKKELGIAPERLAAARNSGVNRTASKKRLLQALKTEADAQGRSLPFKAAF